MRCWCVMAVLVIMSGYDNLVERIRELAAEVAKLKHALGNEQCATAYWKLNADRLEKELNELKGEA